MNNTTANALINALASAVAIVCDIACGLVEIIAGTPLYMRRSRSLPSRHEMHLATVELAIATGLRRAY